MKTETKKVTKVTKKPAVDYKKMYESMKALADSLSNEVNYKADLAFDRGAVIDALEEKLESQMNSKYILAVVTFIVGIIIGAFF